MNSASPAPKSEGFDLLPPDLAHGAGIHGLVAACGPLDLNSVYLYLLLARHFPATCVVALGAAGPAGFISA